MSSEPYVRRALHAAAIAFILSTAYQLIKRGLFPHIALTQSNLTTVVLFTLVMFILTFIMFRREARYVEARQSREHFVESIIQNLPGILGLLGPDGKFLRWNANLEVKLGYSGTEIAEIKALDIV